MHCPVILQLFPPVSPLLDGPVKAMVAPVLSALTARLAGLQPYADVARPVMDIRTFSSTTKTGRPITSCCLCAYGRRRGRGCVGDEVDLRCNDRSVVDDRCLRLDMLSTSLVPVEKFVTVRH